MKDRAKIIVDKFADLMLPKKERLNELENMIREAISEERIGAMFEIKREVEKSINSSINQL